MGFFDFFKKEKKSVLGLPEKFGGGFVQPLASALLEVTLGQKLKVAPGWWAVIVLKDKPQEVFDEGEHELIIPSLPNITKALKLDKSKVVKKGGKQELVFQNTFKCDIYFVSKEIFANQPWQTNMIYKKIKGKKRFSVLMKGSYDFQCVDPKKTVGLFLLEWAKINPGKAQARLNQYINEFATEALEWCKCTSPQELDDKENAINLILPKIEKNISKYGIKISNFKIDRTEFSRDVSAMLAQEKLEKDITSDEINELGAEISLEDKEVEELVLVGDKNETEKEIDTEIKPVVLDMSRDETSKLFKNETAEEKPKKIKKEKKKSKLEEDNLELENTKTNEASENIEEINNEVNKEDSTETKSDAEILKEKIKKPKKDETETVEEGKKICPKCKKVHDLDDTVCDCGCILD